MHSRLFALGLVILAFFAAAASGALLPDGNFHLQVLDVGQGDSILITTPKGARILIDGGPGDRVLRALSKVSGYFNKRIDLIILTHADADHVTGFIPVLKRFKVAAVLRTDAKKNTSTFAAFQNAVGGRQDVKIDWADVISIDDSTRFNVLWPPEGYADALPSGDSNEGSIVSRLEFAGYKFLLPGDLGAASEAKLAASVSPAALSAQVLKVAHHGSKYSSSPQFLSAVGPKIAVISVGADNSYGHPTQETLGRLKAAGAKIFRTDLNGTVGFVVDQRGLVLSAAK